MSSFDIDLVKAEKANALRRYNMKRNCTFCLQLTGALILLWCSFKCCPATINMASSDISFLSHKFYVIVVANILIFLIYHLSTSNTKNNDKNYTLFQPDLYDQYVSFSPSSPLLKPTAGEDKQLVVSPTPEVPPEDDTSYDKQMVVCDNTDYAPVEENPVRDPTVVKDYAIENEEKCYMRTQSEKYVRGEKSHGPDFRRSVTANGRELLVAGDYITPSRKSMYKMSNEEFRLTIDRFIASQKKSLRDENIALLNKERKEYLAITYTAQ